jgi:lantibiotic biosynthesis protein
MPEQPPLLSGDLRDQALDLAAALIESLCQGRPDPRRATLASGSAGLAVCYATAAMAGWDTAAAAADCLDEAVDVVATEPMSSSFYSGFTGIAWAAEFAESLRAGAVPGGTKLGDSHACDRNAAVDEGLDLALRSYPEAGPYDLVNGLAGIGWYALARWPRPAAATCLERVISLLASRARSDGTGICWDTHPAALVGPRLKLYPDGGVDLGMAHGMAGVVPLLARVYQLGIQPALARPLLHGAVAWILAHLVETESEVTVPSFIAAGARPDATRSAWCYGDPGVALALLLAGRDAAEPAWTEAGIKLAVQAARRPLDRTGVTDAGLCHGTAGLGHLFHRMFELTGERELAEAAVLWMKQTVTWCAAHVEGTEPGRAPWNGLGLLEGAAGIALALLSASGQSEPAWDQFLGISSAEALWMCDQ